MDFIKISSQGQITIPLEVRKALGLKPGSKVYIVEEDGRYYLESQETFVMSAFEEVEEALKGHAKTVGFENQEELDKWLEETKKKLCEKRTKQIEDSKE